MLLCIDLYIPDIWVPSEVHTPDDAHATAQFVPARARVHAAADVSSGDPHIRGEILTSLYSYITVFDRILTDSRSLQACSAPQYTHTHTHTHTRTRTHARAHDRGVDTDLCVHTTLKSLAPIRIYVYIQQGRGLCMCALDIENLGCTRARAHVAMRIPMDTHKCSAAPRRTTAAHASTTGRAQSTAVRAGPEAAHTRDKSVTRAEFHAPIFALKADAESNACEPRTRRSAAAGSARTRWRGCGRAHAHTRARARTRAWARTWRMSASAIRAYDDRRTGQGVRMECIKYRSIGVCRSMAVRRGNRTRTHEAQRRTVSTCTRARWCAWARHRHTSSCMALQRGRIYRCYHVYRS
jgi:hypothetical protein